MFFAAVYCYNHSTGCEQG